MLEFQYKTGKRNKRLLNDPKYRSLISQELRNAVQHELTKKQYETLQLYVHERMSMKQIAEKQGVNVSTVSRSISRAVKRIDRRMCLFMDALDKGKEI